MAPMILSPGKAEERVHALDGKSFARLEQIKDKVYIGQYRQAEKMAKVLVRELGEAADLVFEFGLARKENDHGRK